MTVVHELIERGDLAADDVNEALQLRQENAVCELITNDTLLDRILALPNVARTHRSRDSIRSAARAIERTFRDQLKSADCKSILGDVLDGKSILLAGSGFSQPGEGPDSTDATATRLRENLISELLNWQDVHHLEEVRLKAQPLPVLAHICDRVHPPGLKTMVAQSCRMLPQEPLHHHRLLAKLDCFPYIITTNWDRLFERAYATRPSSSSSPLSVIRTDQEIRMTIPGSTTLLKLHGDWDAEHDKWVKDPKVTQRQISSLRSRERLLFRLLTGILTRYNIIVAGFDPSDFNFQSLIAYVNELAPTHDKYAAVINPDPLTPFLVPSENVLHLPLSAHTFLSHCDAWHECQRGSIGARRNRTCRRARYSFININEEADDICACLMTRFPTLRHVEVIDVEPGPFKSDAKRAIGERAASLLAEMATSRQHFAIGSGQSAEYMMEAFQRYLEPRHTHCSFWPAQLDTTGRMTPGSGLANICKLMAVPESHRPRLHHTLPCQSMSYDGFEQLASESRWPKAQIAAIEHRTKAAQAEFGVQPAAFVITASSLSNESTRFASYADAVLSGCRTRQDRTRQDGDRIGREILLKKFWNRFIEKEYNAELFFRPVRFKDNHGPVAPADYLSSPAKVRACMDESHATRVSRNPKLFRAFVARVILGTACINSVELLKAARSRDRRVVLLAAGETRSDAIGTMLDCKIANTMIIDLPLAKRLSKYPAKPEPCGSKSSTT